MPPVFYNHTFSNQDYMLAISYSLIVFISLVLDAVYFMLSSSVSVIILAP